MPLRAYALTAGDNHMFRRGGAFIGKYFGTDGFRGEAGVTVTAEHAYKIGRILGYVYGRGKDKCRDRTSVVYGKSVG